METIEVCEDINVCLSEQVLIGGRGGVEGLQMDSTERSKEASFSGLGRPVPSCR